MQDSIVPERLRDKQKRRSKNGWSKQLGLIVFTLLALSAVAYGAYYFFIPKQENYQLDFYTYAQVGTKDFRETFSARGTIIPKRIVAIEAKVGGRIEEVLVEEGQDVEQGQPLIRLYSEEIVAERDSAERELSETKAKLAQQSIDHELELVSERMKVLDAEKQLEQAISNLELQQVLYGYGSIARVELEKAEQEVETAERRVVQTQRALELLKRKQKAEEEALERSLSLAWGKLEKAEEKIEHFIIRAPFAGRILSLKIPNNRLVTAQQELGELADLGEQVVELRIPPAQTERFGLGTAVTISSGQTDYNGTVAYIAPQAKQGTDGSTVLVRVEFEEEVSHLRPNSAVTASIHLRLLPDSPYLPRGAYLASGQQLFVYVIEGKTAHRREVQFGFLQGNEVQIIRGLEPGETVIVSSYDAFRHLEEIQLLPEGGHAL